MKVSARTAVSLVMYKPDGTCQAFPLRKSHVIIGRTHCCDLRIPLSSVSRKHCEIVIDDSQVLLKDLGSTNGTFVNSARVTERSLHSGDDIAVGPVRFRLEVDKPSSRTTAAASGVCRSSVTVICSSTTSRSRSPKTCRHRTRPRSFWTTACRRMTLNQHGFSDGWATARSPIPSPRPVAFSLLRWRIHTMPPTSVATP